MGRRLCHAMSPLALARGVSACLILLSAFSGAAMAEPLKLYAAGSLKAALSTVAGDFTARFGTPVETAFAPSGLLRERIEKGESPHVFASANMKHPMTLMEACKGGPVVLFARNQLCALTQPGLGVTPASLLDVILDDKTKLGTSTPKADPSGDYAWKLFEKAEAVRAGSFAALDTKALKLTGGPDSAKPAQGRHQYAWVMTEGRADVFLTYCTNAILARKDTPALEVISIPPELAVGADYGLILLAPGNEEAAKLAFYILSPDGQKTLESFGFTALGIEQAK